ALSARGAARRRAPGFRAHRARQGAARATRPPGARPPERAAPPHHAVRTDLPLPAHGRGPGRDRVRVARHGPPRGARDPAARLSHRHRRGSGRERDGRPRQSAGRRPLRRGRSTHPRARDVNVWNWLAVGGAAVLALVTVAEIRRRVGTGAPGRRCFPRPTATPGPVVPAFLVPGAPPAPPVPPDPPHPHAPVTR